MKLTIYTVVNYDYFDFAEVFISSLKENYPDEKLNKIIINDIGLSEEQRVKLQKIHDKVEYIKTSEEIRAETSHTEEWRKVINQKTIGLEKICNEKNYPVLMIDSDMYVLKDFSDEIFYGCDIQVCPQNPHIINWDGFLIDHIGCWFVVHNEKGKSFIEKWQKLMPTIESSHIETPALCEALKTNSNKFLIKENNIQKISSMDYNSNSKILHFRTSPDYLGMKESFEERINNVKNIPDHIKNKIINNTAILIDELLEKHKKKLNSVNQTFKPIHDRVSKRANEIATQFDGTTSMQDCKFLQLLCLEKCPKKILEIGTWVGNTTYSMAFATEEFDSIIYTCDIQDAFFYSQELVAKRIQVFPGTWSGQLLDYGILDGMEFIFNDADLSAEDAEKIYNLASDEFYFVTHDYYDSAGNHEKGFHAIQQMVNTIDKNNGKYELYKPKKEWYFTGYKESINGCCALIKCIK